MGDQTVALLKTAQPNERMADELFESRRGANPLRL